MPSAINTPETALVFKDADDLRPYLATIPDGKCAYITVKRGLLGAKIVGCLMDRSTKV